MSKLDRLMALAEENNRLLHELLGSDLTTSYGCNAHVKEKISVLRGLPSRELAVLEFPDDLESYGDYGA
jgi:hypothetical protein